MLPGGKSPCFLSRRRLLKITHSVPPSPNRRTDSSRVFDLGSDGEDEESDPGPARAKGLRRLLDGFLEGRAQPPLPESTLETKVAKLLAQGHTKPPEQGRAAAGNKLLIFTTGCLTYSPHQIGEGPGAGPPVGRAPSSVCPGAQL